MFEVGKVLRIWSILLIKSDLKWCIHLSRSLYVYLKRDTFCKMQFMSIFKYVMPVESKRPSLISCFEYASHSL